jgi:enoyl-CoA hydratase/carnithine racemase
MENSMSTEEVGFSIDGYVATVELRRPPNNFLDIDLIGSLASVLEQLDEDANVRSIVLAAAGKHFCAGANLIRRVDDQAAGKPQPKQTRHLYHEAQRLIATRKPIVAAVHGSAIGAGLGLALVADFRVTCKEARLAANFTAMGYHPGFGMTCTLPRVVGHQRAKWLLLTGKRIPATRRTPSVSPIASCRRSRSGRSRRRWRWIWRKRDRLACKPRARH